MDEESESGVFDLFSANTIQTISERESFVAAVGDFFQKYARLWDCSVDVSERRLGDAYDFWRSDTERTLLKGIAGESTTLNHFKHAAFIAFWLRRMVPINNIWWLRDGEWREAHSHSATDDLPSDAVVVGPSREQKFFAKFGGELCALMTGYHICLAYELSARDIPEKDWPFVIPQSAPPARFLFEYPKLLKHKNTSSHGIYMMFHALFVASPMTFESVSA